jgi:hypothetical protein
MEKFLYPEVIERLKIKCFDFLNNQLDIFELQIEIHRAEVQIVAFEEKWLRQYLFELENKIEELIFMYDETHLKNQAEELVKNLIKMIN